MGSTTSPSPLPELRLVEGVLDFGDVAEVRVDGISGVYRLSEHTLCVEMHANKIVDGKVQKVMVLRNTWDRSSWLEAQALFARIFGQITALSSPSNGDDEVRVH
jgi:hypothetical protein